MALSPAAGEAHRARHWPRDPSAGSVEDGAAESALRLSGLEAGDSATGTPSVQKRLSRWPVQRKRSPRSVPRWSTTGDGQSRSLVKVPRHVRDLQELQPSLSLHVSHGQLREALGPARSSAARPASALGGATGQGVQDRRAQLLERKPVARPSLAPRRRRIASGWRPPRGCQEEAAEGYPRAARQPQARGLDGPGQDELEDGGVGPDPRCPGLPSSLNLLQEHARALRRLTGGGRDEEHAGAGPGPDVGSGRERRAGPPPRASRAELALAAADRARAGARPSTSGPEVKAPASSLRLTASAPMLILRPPPTSPAAKEAAEPAVCQAPAVSVCQAPAVSVLMCEAPALDEAPPLVVPVPPQPTGTPKQDASSPSSTQSRIAARPVGSLWRARSAPVLPAAPAAPQPFVSGASSAPIKRPSPKTALMLPGQPEPVKVQSPPVRTATRLTLKGATARLALTGTHADGSRDEARADGSPTGRSATRLTLTGASASLTLPAASRTDGSPTGRSATRLTLTGASASLTLPAASRRLTLPGQSLTLPQPEQLDVLEPVKTGDRRPSRRMNALEIPGAGGLAALSSALVVGRRLSFRRSMSMEGTSASARGQGSPEERSPGLPTSFGRGPQLVVPTNSRAGSKASSSGLSAGSRSPSVEASARSSRAASKEEGDSETLGLCRHRWLVVFHRIKYDGEVHKQRVAQALELAGFLYPDPSVIDEAFSSVSPIYETLAMREFTRFVENFEVREFEQLEQAFDDVAALESPGEGGDEVPIEAFPDIARMAMPRLHLLSVPLEEVQEELGKLSGHRTLCLEEVKAGMRMLRSNGCFSAEERRRFSVAFRNFATDCPKTVVTMDRTKVMDASLMSRAAAWLGVSLPMADINSVMDEVLTNVTELNENDFLSCLWRLRQYELTQVESAINKELAKSCVDSPVGFPQVRRSFMKGSQPRRPSLVKTTTSYKKKHIESLKSILRVTGVFPDLCSVRDAAEEAGLLGIELADLDLDGAWRLVEAYRACDGFSKAEVEQIGEAFARYDHDGSGRIPVNEVGKLLRVYGYFTGYDEQEHLKFQVIPEGSETFELHDFVKIARLYRDREIHKAAKIFSEFDGGNRGYMSKFQCRHGIRSLGYNLESSADIIEAVAPDDDDAPADALLAVPSSQGQGRLSVPTPSGPPAFAVNRKVSDSSFGRQVSDHVTRAPSKAGRMFRKAKNAIATQKALRSMGPSNNTKVSQSDFLEICRQLHNRRRETFRNNAGFSAAEVNSMKQQFFDFDNDRNGYISSAELGVMLQNVFPNMASSVTLRPYLLKVLQEVAVSERENGDGLDFPDFLRIMRSFADLLDKDPVAREEDVIAKCGFTRDEVEEFRDLFAVGASMPGDLDEFEQALERRTTIGLVEFMRMVEKVAPLSAAELLQLRSLYKDIVELGAGLRIAGFPEFLLLMRRLVDINFADIKNSIFVSDDSM